MAPPRKCSYLASLLFFSLSLVFLFLASQKKVQQQKRYWRSNWTGLWIHQQRLEWEVESEKKKHWTSFFIFSSPSMFTLMLDEKKSRKINFLTLSVKVKPGRFEKKYRFCYDALSEWIIPHTGRIYEHYFTPSTPVPLHNPSLFYKFEYTARFFLVFLIFTHHLYRPSLGSLVHIRRDFFPFLILL